MNPHFKHLLFLLFLIQSQWIGAFDVGQKPAMVIPFESQNGFIVVEMVLQEKLPLKFIFDTGTECTIITKIEITNFLDFQYDKRFQIIGADLSQPMHAQRVKNASIFLHGVNVSEQSIFVLEEDYFNFEELLGSHIHGIIGMEFFNDYVVDIDYRKKVLKLIPIEKFKTPNKKFQKIPITISRNKPYLATKLLLNKDLTLDLLFLLDTGANISAMVYNNTHPSLSMPDKTLKGNLGTGLGGSLDGYIGIIPSFGFGNFNFDELIVNFMEIDINQASRKSIQGNGIVGNVLLSKFHMIIDFPNKAVYMKPTRNYNKKVKFDKSGLSLFAAGEKLNRFFVQAPFDNSPADKAGIKRGDEILRLNGIPWQFLSINVIKSILSKKEGKRIKILIMREGKRIRKEFVLHNLL